MDDIRIRDSFARELDRKLREVRAAAPRGSEFRIPIIGGTVGPTDRERRGALLKVCRALCVAEQFDEDAPWFDAELPLSRAECAACLRNSSSNRDVSIVPNGPTGIQVSSIFPVVWSPSPALRCIMTLNVCSCFRPSRSAVCG